MILLQAQVKTTTLEPELSSNSLERSFLPVSAYTFFLTSSVIFSVFHVNT